MHGVSKVSMVEDSQASSVVWIVNQPRHAVSYIVTIAKLESFL